MYKEIIVTTTSSLTDDVADIMWLIGASGVKILDPKDLDYVLHSDTCWDYVDDNLLNVSNIAKVSFFVEDFDVKDKLKELNEYLEDEKFKDKISISVMDVPDVNWEEDWKKFYQPIYAGKYTVIAEWLEEIDDGIIIKINPSKAFGTGEHASTRLCLQLMSYEDFNNKHVIDVGAGSGILGIAAAKSGAKFVEMCDIDKETLECASENAILNNVNNKIRLTAGGIDAVPNFKADFLLCNLTADILIRIVDDMIKYITQNGTLICSGVLDTRAQEVIEKFADHNFVFKNAIYEGEWVGLKFTYGN